MLAKKESGQGGRFFDINFSQRDMNLSQANVNIFLHLLAHNTGNDIAQFLSRNIEGITEHPGNVPYLLCSRQNDNQW